MIYSNLRGSVVSTLSTLFLLDCRNCANSEIFIALYYDGKVAKQTILSSEKFFFFFKYFKLEQVDMMQQH
jgi:hypothetical protein